MENNTLQNTFDWIKSCQEPSEKLANIQMGVFLEEIGETFDAIRCKDFAHSIKMGHLGHVVIKEIFAKKFKKGEYELDLDAINLVELLDGLCDVIVTATTTAYALGFDLVGAMNEVNRANYSKFVDGKPVYDENGKITKGPDYVRPNLEPYVNKE